MVTTPKMRWQPKNRDVEGGAHARAIKTKTTVHVNPDATEPQEIPVPTTIAGKGMMTNHAQDEDAVVAIAMNPMGTMHAENAAMCRLGWKPSNYSSMPTSRTTRTPKVVVVVAEAADEGDNHLMS